MKERKDMLIIHISCTFPSLPSFQSLFPFYYTMRVCICMRVRVCMCMCRHVCACVYVWESQKDKPWSGSLALVSLLWLPPSSSTKLSQLVVLRCNSLTQPGGPPSFSRWPVTVTRHGDSYRHACWRLDAEPLHDWMQSIYRFEMQCIHESSSFKWQYVSSLY